jgi:hypothetical protein
MQMHVQTMHTAGRQRGAQEGVQCSGGRIGHKDDRALRPS